MISQYLTGQFRPRMFQNKRVVKVRYLYVCDTIAHNTIVNITKRM